jgi:hypothetical protein
MAVGSACGFHGDVAGFLEILAFIEEAQFGEGVVVVLLACEAAALFEILIHLILV